MRNLPGNCMYDNPISECREIWINGTIVNSISHSNLNDETNMIFRPEMPFIPSQTHGNNRHLYPPNYTDEDTLRANADAPRSSTCIPLSVVQMFLAPEEYRGYLIGTALGQIAKGDFKNAALILGEIQNGK